MKTTFLLLVSVCALGACAPNFLYYAHPAALPSNPFGMGAAYSEVAVDQAPYRERQLQQAKYLAGTGGHVRLWCQLSRLSECQASVQRAYQFDLVPLVLINDAVFASDSDSPHRNFSGYATQFAHYVDNLPILTGRDVVIELANEPNFSDWWFSRTCSATTRAIEIAQASAQVIDKVKRLNKTNIKIAGVSLSPYSDSNPTSNGAGGCNRGTRLDLPSTFFVTEMKKERPDLFHKLDAWNSHPYSSEMFGLCARPNCPAVIDDPALRMYKEEMIAAGVDSNLPIYLTEVGTYINVSSQEMADLFVNNANLSMGMYPQVWLAGGAYNNVKGIMGFILPIPGFESYAWLNPNSLMSESAPYQTPYPIYSQVRRLRLQLGFGHDTNRLVSGLNAGSSLNTSAFTAP